MMKRYAVTFHDYYTNRNYTIETVTINKALAKYHIYESCGDVDIIDIKRIPND